jgi:tetratricopeptide (TPR) repeat protein
MKNQYLLSSVCISILAIFVIAGCAPSMRVPVTRPAEINLKGVDKIAIGEIKGNIGQGVADLLTNRLFESDRFEVVDRENLDRIMREHRLNLVGAVDKDTAAEVGKLTGASALIFGSANAKYKQQTSKSKWYKNKDGSSYRFYHKTGKAKVNTNLRVVDLTTGKILAVKSFTEEASKKDWERNEWPADIDKDAVISEAANSTIDAFMKMIAPYTDYVSVSFEKSKLPEVESGVNYAKQGMWKDALEQLELAVRNSPDDAGAWYNLGIAYEYNYMFEKAIEAFKKANSIKPSDKYINEISNVKRLEAERKKLAQQGVVE